MKQLDVKLMHPAEQITLIIGMIYRSGMTTTSGGNLSILDENGDIWITPAGIDKGSLTPKDIMCVKADGTINRTAHTGGLCCLMIKTDDEKVRNNAWEFMKWWVGADAQVRFGREMESVLGTSGRYMTANREALPQLGWNAKQLRVLEAQMSQTHGFPEIAGGYSTTRHMTNAIRRVITAKEDKRETLMNYARTINEEIRIKRREFNLPLD